MLRVRELESEEYAFYFELTGSHSRLTQTPNLSFALFLVVWITFSKSFYFDFYTNETSRLQPSGYPYCRWIEQ